MDIKWILRERAARRARSKSTQTNMWSPRFGSSSPSSASWAARVRSFFGCGPPKSRCPSSYATLMSTSSSGRRQRAVLAFPGLGSRIEAAAPLPLRRGVGIADTLPDGADVDVAVVDKPGLLMGIRIAAACELGHAQMIPPIMPAVKPLDVGPSPRGPTMARGAAVDALFCRAGTSTTRTDF
jgi:hypothetical protein